MEVRFTRHARNRMRLYEIDEADVRTALASADLVTIDQPGLAHVVHGFPGKYGDKPLKVVYTTTGPARFLVVSVFPYKGKARRV